MIDISTCGAVILASGLSRRFGEEDKLMADFNGKPLASYCAEMAAQAGFQACVAVVPSDEQNLAQLFRTLGIDVIENPDAALGQGSSLSLGMRSLPTSDLSAIFVLLADMPFVSKDDLEKLAHSIGDKEAAIFAAEGRNSPPALFTPTHFAALKNLSGDTGAKAIIDQATTAIIDIDPSHLHDLDEPADFLRYSAVSEEESS